MSAHTPGPWLIREGDEWTHDVVTLEGVNTEGDPMYWTVASANGRRDEVKANVRLIAAAPDLLEALKLCAAVCAGETSYKRGLVEALEAARAALTKAEGAKP